ncbi:MAG TPA: glycosyltransferase family 4 protein [Bryobacteraceae bacterium]|nr:glycosyltransferase family 4 protein [Bryobacteraceae bacterium]
MPVCLGRWKLVAVACAVARNARNFVNILAVDPSASVGGAQLSLLDVLLGLQARGHSILLAAPPNGNLLAAAAARGIRTEIWNLPHSLRRAGQYTNRLALLLSVLGAIRVLWSLAGIARRHHSHVVYSNGIKSHILTGLLRLFLWRPLVWHVRDFVSHRAIARLLFPLARITRISVIANSRAVAAEWHRRGVPAIVVHNGFHFQPQRNAEKNSGRLQLLTAGVLSAWKGFDIVLRACSFLPEHLGWQLTICGGEIYETDGHLGERKRLEQLAEELAIANQVTFTGMVEDLGPYFQKSDILLHGSVRPEPFGRVVAEAMLAGVPVIASRGGGIPEIIRAGIDGLLYPMGNAQELCNAICCLAEDTSRRSAMGKTARARILADFSLDGKIDRIEQILITSS